MQALSLTQVAEITNGKLMGNPELAHLPVSEVISDSRKVFKNNQSLFFALSGPFNNAHLYIPELQEKGIQAFVVSDPSSLNNTGAFILVEDTREALQKLAAYYRAQFSYPVVGITGSNGKTIVKEWLHDILSPKHHLVRSPKSYNSQIGVPLSVLLMDESHQLGVFEAGISKKGEMHRLEKIIAPNIGLFTNIGDAHQENFDSTRQKIREKLELFKNCDTLVYRNDVAEVKEEIEDFLAKNKAIGLSWSLENAAADIQFLEKKLQNSTKIEAKHGGKNDFFSIPFTDDSALENACHSFACLIALKLDPEAYIEEFKKLQALAMRLEIKQGINNCLLINDYYNSDLNAFSIALSVLKQQANQHHLEQVVVLSDIQQSGQEKADLYREVNALLEQWGIHKLIGIGPDILSCRNAFSMKGEFYPDRESFQKQFNRTQFAAAAVLIKGARNFEFEKISSLLQEKAHQTVLEINLNAIVHNLGVYRQLVKPETKIMAMVKAFSYGSGDVEVARLLQYQNIDYLAVAVADEGILLRESGIHVPIVVMNPEKEAFQLMIDHNLEPNIYSLQLLEDFAWATSIAGRKNFPVHLKLDTGMNRLGIKNLGEILSAVNFLKTNDRLRLQSVFSHLAGSDDPQLDAFSFEQMERFETFCDSIERELPYAFDKHILNTAGIERFSSKQFDMVRLGIGLYGISQTGLPLENISSLLSTISQIKTVETNETVGYNRRGEIRSKSKIAIVPLGYADGIDRKLGNGKGSAFVNEQRVPIIGNICMDMLMLDITEVAAEIGDRVEFFGPNLPISELARTLDTIPYEILTGISQRVKRIYLQE